ncbi:protein-disulfide reductase DsbD domain-containing protein [Novosphingobium panipatense]
MARTRGHRSAGANAAACPGIDRRQKRSPRPGTNTRIAIRMTPETGWHGYWINPGTAAFRSSRMASAGRRSRRGARTALPTLLELGGLASYVHEGAFTLLADLAIDRSVAPGTALPVKVDLTWLACSDSLCVPERTTLQLTLRAGDGAVDRSRQSLFSAAEAALPSSGRAQGRLEAADGRWSFVVSGAQGLNVGRTYLFPMEDGWFEASAKQQATRAADGTIRIEVAAPGPAPSRASPASYRTDGKVSCSLV